MTPKGKRIIAIVALALVCVTIGAIVIASIAFPSIMGTISLILGIVLGGGVLVACSILLIRYLVS